jgi:hypothetical protein
LSVFQSELARIAEIAVREAVQEWKTSNTVESGRRRRNTDRRQVVIEAQSGELDA